MTLDEIDAQLDALHAARLKRLTTGTTTKIGYAGGSTERSVGTLEEINMEIARLELLRGRLTGSVQSGGPIRIGFGARP